jgi:hypothetical protein
MSQSREAIAITATTAGHIRQIGPEATQFSSSTAQPLKALAPKDGSTTVERPYRLTGHQCSWHRVRAARPTTSK